MERAGCFSRISLYADITRRVSCLRRKLMWFKSLYSYRLMDLGRRFRRAKAIDLVVCRSISFPDHRFIPDQAVQVDRFFALRRSYVVLHTRRFSRRK
jgi:hypothetical protein